MNTQEFVEDYIQNVKTKLTKFFVAELILEAFEIAVFVLALIKLMDNEAYMYSSIAVFVVCFNVTLLLNIKKLFGSFKEFVKSSNIYRSYNEALKSFQNSNDKSTFDQKLSELELLIKENK